MYVHACVCVCDCVHTLYAFMLLYRWIPRGQALWWWTACRDRSLLLTVRCTLPCSPLSSRNFQVINSNPKTPVEPEIFSSYSKQHAGIHITVLFTHLTYVCRVHTLYFYNNFHRQTSQSASQ